MMNGPKMQRRQWAVLDCDIRTRAPLCLHCACVLCARVFCVRVCFSLTEGALGKSWPATPLYLSLISRSLATAACGSERGGRGPQYEWGDTEARRTKGDEDGK